MAAKLFLVALFLAVAALLLYPLCAAARALRTGRLEMVGRYGIPIDVARQDRPGRYWFSVMFLGVTHLLLLAALLGCVLLVVLYDGPL